MEQEYLDVIEILSRKMYHQQKDIDRLEDTIDLLRCEIVSQENVIWLLEQQRNELQKKIKWKSS